MTSCADLKKEKFVPQVPTCKSRQLPHLASSNSKLGVIVLVKGRRYLPIRVEISGSRLKYVDI